MHSSMPRIFIWLFVVSAVSVFVVQLAVQLINFKTYFVNVPGPINAEMIWVLFYSSLMPLLFFLLAYFISPRKHVLKASNIYENLIVALPALLIYSMLEITWNQAQSSFRLTNGSFSTYWVSQMAMLGIVTVIYALFLIYLRRRKIWR